VTRIAAARTLSATIRAPRAPAAVANASFNWRQSLGAFQIRIPVTDKTVMRPIEEDTLAILKWRLQEQTTTYRWRPVWERLIAITEARVAGLGGDPAKIPPSLGGYQPPCPEPGGDGDGDDDRDRLITVGKIVGVVFDRFGDFAGFDQLTEHGHEYRYVSREAGIERIVQLAWRERWVVEVVAKRRGHDEDAVLRVERVVLRRRAVPPEGE
jgi:hypothetical protein